MSEHFPHPGPGSWDWRCLTCDQPVTSHTLRWFTFWKTGWWKR